MPGQSLKALAERQDMTLGDLIEGIVLHAFQGRQPFSPEALDVIAQLERACRRDLTAGDSHRLEDHP